MDSKNKQFQDALRHSAKVDREELNDDRTRMAAIHLKDVAKLLAPRDGLEYLGSATVHVFKSAVANELYFADNVAFDCPETVAQAAMKNLTGSVMEHYGRRRPRTRSNF